MARASVSKALHAKAPRASVKVVSQPRTKSAGARLHAVEPQALLFDAATMVPKMREGMPSQMVLTVAENLGISQDKLFDALGLAKSTLKSRISKKAALAPVEQDRLYRVLKVLERARDVLSDNQAAVSWVHHKNRALGGEAPLTLLDTEAGYDLVLDTLGQIEYGVY